MISSHKGLPPDRDLAMEQAFLAEHEHSRFLAQVAVPTVALVSVAIVVIVAWGLWNLAVGDGSSGLGMLSGTFHAIRDGHETKPAIVKGFFYTMSGFGLLAAILGAPWLANSQPYFIVSIAYLCIMIWPKSMGCYERDFWLVSDKALYAAAQRQSVRAEPTTVPERTLTEIGDVPFTDFAWRNGNTIEIVGEVSITPRTFVLARDAASLFACFNPDLIRNDACAPVIAVPKNYTVSFTAPHP